MSEIIEQLWDIIKNGSHGKLTDRHRDDSLALHTIGHHLYWGDYWVTDDQEPIRAANAFNALRGRADLIYRNTGDYLQRNKYN